MASRPPPPSAPTRSRRLPTRQAAASSVNNTTSPDELADDLTSLRITTAPKTKPSSSAAPTTAASRRLPPSSRSLAVSKPPAAKATQPAPASTLSPTERGKQAMRTVNTSLQTLSGVSKSGWRATPTSAAPPSSRPAPLKSASSSSSPSSTASPTQNKDRVEAAVGACGAALATLRQLIREGKINNRATEVEKAAGSLVANLVEMELYELALTELASMRVAILSWYDSDASLCLPPPLKPSATIKGRPAPASRRPPLLTYAHVLALPLPLPSFFDPPTLSEALSSTSSRPLAQDIVPLVLAVQQYTLGCLFRADLSAEEVARRPEVVWEQLGGHGNPFEWRRTLEEYMAEAKGESAEVEGTRRRVDAMMTSMFGTLTKGCIAMDQLAPPEVLLSLRSRALLFFATTRPLYAEQAKLDACYNQTRKVLLLFGRRSEEQKAGETKINEGVKRIFEEVVELLVQKEAKLEGKAWVTLCEVVLHIAKRADDSAMVERVSVLIDSKAFTSGVVDPEAQVSQLCAKLVSALSILETFCKTGEDKGVADQLRRVVTTISVLSTLRSQDLLPESHTKIDKVLERLRYVAARQLKSGRRLDQLITNVGDTKLAVSEVETGLLALLKALAAHVQALHKCYSESTNSSPSRTFSNRKALYEGAVESHLILAYSQLIIDNRITFTHAFANLEQSLPLIAAATTGDSLHISDLDNAYSLRTLASAYYNIGGTLYNAGKPEAAIRFIKRSCQIGKAALEAASREEDAFLSTGEEDTSRIEALADLRKHMTKRWELLALAQQAIGEKRLAYEAYVSAIADLSDDSKLALGHVAATSSITTLVTREANLFKLVQRSTKLAAFDLLLPGPNASLRERLSGAGYSTSASAAVIELQVVSLEPNLDRIEALNTIPALLDDLLELYVPAQFPMRRARTLVRRLQHSCAPASTRDDSVADDLAEIAGLCSPKTPVGEDASLRSFASQYLAFSHIWLGFHAHQALLPSASESTSQAAREGLRILRAAFDKDIPPSPSKPLVAAAKPAVKPSPKKAVPTSRRAAAKVADKAVFKTPKTSRTLPGSRTFKAELVTPPSKGAIDLAHRSTPPRGEVIALLLDDPDRSYSSLETMANLLGALGYSLLRISYLRFLRRLAATLHPQAHDAAYVASSAYLGHEYVRLGKTSRAGVVFAQAELRIQACAKSGGALAAAAHVTYLTHYAEYLAIVGNRERSSKAYSEAHHLALTLVPDDSSLSVPNRIVERTRLLQRSASAAGVCSVMLQRRGDLTRALGPAMQALRVWTRALNNISRLSAPPTSEASSAFTSSATDKDAPLSDFPNGSRKRQPGPSSGPNTGLVWQVSESLASALLRVATLHSVRGNPKSAEHYTQQAIDFAQDLGSTRLFARALVVRAEIRLHAGSLTDASSDLDLVDQVFGEKQTSCPEAIDAHRIRADLFMRDPAVAGAAKDAQAYCLEAQKSLDLFVEAAEAGEAGQSPSSKLASPGRTTLVKFSSPIRSSPVRPSPNHPSPSPGRHRPSSDSILPTLHAYLLRMRVGLLQKENRRNKDDECQMLLRRLSKYRTSDEDLADELKLLASIQFRKLLSRLNSDAVLQALPEAVLSMPTFGVLAAKAGSPSSGSSLLHCLRDVEILLADAVALSLSRAEPTKLRELSLFTANLRAVQASVGPTSKQSIPARVASVLDLGLAVTLRREMLDAIDRKLAGHAAPDDIEWPMPDRSTSTSGDHPDGAARPMLDFWTSARERYRTESAEPTMTDPSLSTLLPPNWTVVSLHLATERDCLLLVRHRHGSTPLIFKLPLDRFARREDEEEEESFTYDAALAELRDVIVASNAGAQNAKDVTGKDARAAWWKERKNLDVRLQNLTLLMEDSWLGAFKTVFLDARHFTHESIATFKSQIERVMKRTVIRSAKKTTRFKLDDSILACLSALPPDARDEDIEDAFYFMLESLQFSGMPVAIDEIEVDQVVCDLRIPLEELYAANANSPPIADEHTFLILDKAIQSFPWESIPCLRGRSISRLPSVAFLRDRIALAGVLADGAAPDAGPPPTSRHEILVDSSRTSFVLNPSGDLKTTQNNFEPWLEKMKGAGWSGVVGRAPSEEEVKVALSTRDLFLYFGHGGAEQFIRSQTVRNLERCAVTMLWGCSSGLLKDLGDFDPVGTPYHYMIAGCPALVANLWDVTDKDIDKFSDAVFRKLGLDGEPRDEDDAGPTLAGAIGGSRDVCLLRYLNGAAPVVYGVPVRFSRIAV